MATRQKFSVVSPEAARQRPYPYVRVNEDGTVRELHEEERKYLETPFLPFDGGRPYVKRAYLDRNGGGSLAGFCPRSAIPEGLPVGDAPAEDPNPPMSKEELVAFLQSKSGPFDVRELPEGTIMMRPRTKLSWLDLLRRWTQRGRRT